MNKNNSSISFIGLLQLVFIVLKLCNVITWSWWAVLIPIWIELFILMLIFIFNYRVIVKVGK